jgi:methionyl-tRNA formyltransferase
MQPETVRDPAFLDALRELEPDVAVVVAYGQIFRRSLLSLPRLGCINLHGSLLPKYRGAAPIQAAIAAGDTVTGVTTMRMSRGLDSGPMLLEAEIPIGPHDTSAALAPKLASVGAGLMVETLDRLAAGTLEAREQDPEQATFAPKIEKSDGQVDWTLEARQIYARWRAFQPWPGLHAELGDRAVKIVAGRSKEGPDGTPAEILAGGAEPGTILGLAEGDASGEGEARAPTMDVACGGDTIFSVERLQRPGKKPLAAADFVNGERIRAGERFSLP